MSIPEPVVESPMSSIITVHVHTNMPQEEIDRINTALANVASKLDKLIQEVKTVSAGLDALKASVERLETASESATTLLNELGALIRANAGDETAMLELADEVEQRASELGDAVQANTPGA